MTHLGSIKIEARFDAFYSEVIHDSMNVTAAPTLAGQRKRARRLDDGASPHSHRYETLKDRYHHMYFEVNELTATKVEKRFIQKDLGIINETESTLINGNAQNCFSSDLEMYLNDDFKLLRLKTQLSLLPHIIKTSSMGIRNVTNM